MLKDLLRYLASDAFRATLHDAVLGCARGLWGLVTLAGWAFSQLILELIAVLVGPVWRAIKLVLQTLLALALLFEEWGWRPLYALLERVARLFNWTWIRTWIEGLPPYGALALFAAPAVCLFPLKLLALYLFASGHPVLGVGLIAFAKIVGTAVVARIFILTQPKLMAIPWFASAYRWFIPWKDAMFAHIRASAAWRAGRFARVVAKRWALRVKLALAPRLAALRKRVMSWFNGSMSSSL
jgi:hypothetical protein